MYLVDTTKSHCSKFDNNFAFQKSIDLFSIVDYTYVLQAVHYLNDLLCKQLSENTIFGKLKKRLMVEINLWILPNKCYVNAQV